MISNFQIPGPTDPKLDKIAQISVVLARKIAARINNEE